MRNGFTNVVVIACLALAVAAILTLVLTQFVNFGPVPAALTLPPPSPAVGAGAGQPQVQGAVYNPPRPEDAPADMREAVMLGYTIVTDTQKVAANYVGNELTCSNCHFGGGISQGGQNGGLSLVGVAAKYPQYRQREGYSTDLVTRINDCFERSENGKAMPPASKEMQSLVAYFHWISKDIPIYAAVPWTTLNPVKSDHKPDATVGQQVYAQACAGCHGVDGSGTAAAPPLWGPKSYNDGAGMTKAATLAAFAHLNMPRGNANMTQEQALDVAQYVDTQPRPHFAGQS